MRYVLKSAVPFCIGAGGKICKRAVFEQSPGFVQIHHLPIRSKAFSAYFLDCENPCPELCRRVVWPDEVHLELSPVPLPLASVCVSEKTFDSRGVRCSAKLMRRANCFSIALDSADFCESFSCDPLSVSVTLEIVDVGAPLVCVLEDETKLTVFSCDGDFRIFLQCECSQFSASAGRITLRRHFPDSRKRFEDVVITAKDGPLRLERAACGFSARKKTFPELVPLYFLECLSEGFWDEARDYLDDSLRNSDFEAMRAFFGHCSAVRLVGDRIAIENDGMLKFFFFDLDDGRISNFRD